MYSCFDCGHLDKSRKKYSDKNEDYFMYGCNHRGPDKFVCGWCNSDKDLKRSYQGCSDWIEIKKEDKFLKGLAKNFEVIVVGERYGNHITYQYNTDRFLNEFFHNDFKNTEHDGDIVTDFYYRGNLIINYKIFPKACGTDLETIYDVVGYIKKMQYLDEIKNGKNPEIKTVVSSKNQLPGQMSIMDFIGGNK